MITQTEIQNTIDFLETHKWGRGSYHNAQKDCYCAVGAFAAANPDKTSYYNKYCPDYVAYSQLSKLFLKVKGDVCDSLMFYNDQHAKSKRDVIRVLKKMKKVAPAA